MAASGDAKSSRVSVNADADVVGVANRVLRRAEEARHVLDDAFAASQRKRCRDLRLQLIDDGGDNKRVSSLLNQVMSQPVGFMRLFNSSILVVFFYRRFQMTQRRFLFRFRR